MCGSCGQKYRRNKTPPVVTEQVRVDGVVKPSTLVNPAEPKPVRGYQIGSRVKK